MFLACEKSMLELSTKEISTLIKSLQGDKKISSLHLQRVINLRQNVPPCEKAWRSGSFNARKMRKKQAVQQNIKRIDEIRGVSTGIIVIVFPGKLGKKTDLICEVKFIFPYFKKSIANEIINCKGVGK